MTMAAEVYDLAARVAAAVQSVLPPRFRGVMRITVDNGLCRAHDVTLEFRPPQPKAGHTIQ